MPSGKHPHCRKGNESHAPTDDDAPNAVDAPVLPLTGMVSTTCDQLGIAPNTFICIKDPNKRAKRITKYTFGTFCDYSPDNNMYLLAVNAKIGKRRN
tara:strand:+ start:556 stop:846 length:291 start_codon:yes stop_codon:yes gene_type:complete